MCNFAITGVAGYIAPRHLKAIKDTKNNLVAALDPHDSVGILDRYFKNVSYFREPERFDRYLEKKKNSSDKIDYVSICSPNYLHDSHIRMALRVGADVICEKPLVLNPWNCDSLVLLEKEYGKKINTVLQLRNHPSIISLKDKYQNSNGKHQIDLTYITSRGPWYLYSWKGDIEKSGGLISNIGVHFFDMLIWIFGEVENYGVEINEQDIAVGSLELERASVNWKLSINEMNLPKGCDQSTFRSITVDGEEVEFSGGFTDLHTEVYKDILSGGGFGVLDVKPTIELVHNLRNL